MLAVREDFGLVRQVRTAAIDQINARQMVLLGDFLRAKVFLHRHREIGTTFHRGVIADDHAGASGYLTNARDHTCTGGLVIIHAIGRQRADLQKGRARINQLLNPLTRQQFSTFYMALARPFWPAASSVNRLFTQVLDKLGHGGAIAGEFRAGRI